MYAHIQHEHDDPHWKAWMSLLLPNELVESLREDAARKGQEKRREKANVSEKHLAETLLDTLRDPKPTRGPNPPPPAWPEPFQRNDLPCMKVIDRESVETLSANFIARYGKGDDKERYAEMIKKIRARGSYRLLSTLRTDWRAALAKLRDDFPNFGEFIEHLGAMLTLAESDDRTPRFTPSLLNGPPGIGKTVLVERLCGILGGGFLRIGMAGLDNPSLLTGSHEYWANTKTGAVFNTLVERDFANPILVLDEIDKAVLRYTGDPLGGLYELLEPQTACHFCDLSAPSITLDASRILWIATSNDAGAIPAPILSRLRRFDIPGPTREESRSIVASIYAAFRFTLRGARDFDDLDDEVIDRLTSIPPRRLTQALPEAIGRALADGRRSIRVCDLRLPQEECNRGRRIGFT